MKTTVEIADGLLADVKQVAREEGTTVRALLEDGLRRVLEERGRRGTFTLRRVTFKGEGLQDAFLDAPWERIRETAYEGHGA